MQERLTRILNAYTSDCDKNPRKWDYFTIIPSSTHRHCAADFRNQKAKTAWKEICAAINTAFENLAKCNYQAAEEEINQCHAALFRIQDEMDKRKKNGEEKS